jgi:hypothetical protein
VVCVPLSYAGDVGYRYGLVLAGERRVLIGPLSVGVSVSSVLRSVVYRVLLRISDIRYALENVCTHTVNCSHRYRVPPVDSGVFHVLLRRFMGVSLSCFFTKCTVCRNVCAL